MAGQVPLPLLPADAVPVGDAAGLVEGPDGGLVLLFGAAAYAWEPGDEAGRRLAAVQLVKNRTASRRAVAAAFGCNEATVWRWQQAYDARGLAGLLGERPGPKRAWLLTDALAERIRTMDADGATLAAIAAATGVSTDTVRRALGRTGRKTATRVAATSAPRQADGNESLPMVPAPAPRSLERAAARSGLLEQAEPVFTEGAQLPLVGLLLILPALQGTGLLTHAAAVYGRLRNGFYGLQAVMLTLLFLALIREPRAEGATRVPPPDLGRVLGLDRAPEVKTIRRKLAELTGAGRADQLLAALARHHATVREQAVGFLHVDGHVRVYSGTRSLPKTHVTRMRIAAPATVETWVCDGDGDPVFVLTAPPGASLVGELRRLLPELRKIVGESRRITVVFDRGGYSPALFAEILDAGFDLLTYRKGHAAPVADQAFTVVDYVDPDGTQRCWQLADTRVDITVADREPLELRQVTRIAADGHQMHTLTSRTDLTAAEIAWRVSSRWRQENYFKYARTHFALDALDSYADAADDPDRDIPNPDKQAARQHAADARAALHAAETALADAIEQARLNARSTGKAMVPATVTRAVDAARSAVVDAEAQAADVPSRTTLGQVNPNGRLLVEERKLITHAIRMAAYNSESVLARLLRPHYARADDEARALLREAFTLAGDMHIADGQLHVTLNPASAPRRTRALAALADQLNATQTRYPGTDLVLRYSVKQPSDRA